MGEDIEESEDARTVSGLPVRRADPLGELDLDAVLQREVVLVDLPGGAVGRRLRRCAQEVHHGLHDGGAVLLAFLLDGRPGAELEVVVFQAAAEVAAAELGLVELPLVVLRSLRDARKEKREGGN